MMKNRTRRRNRKPAKSQSSFLLKTLFAAAFIAAIGNAAKVAAAETNHNFRFQRGENLRVELLSAECVKTQNLTAAARDFEFENNDERAPQTTRRATIKTGDEPVSPKQIANEDGAPPDSKPKFHWKPALAESFKFLVVQHGWRVATQPSTRRELPGKFFPEWAQSVKNLRGWNDSNNFFINYVAHPLQGGLTGRIFVNNSDAAKKQEFGKSPEYVKSRLKAMLWSTAWSAQFELGPISEASIGNVGLRTRRGYSTMAWVDLVVTPTLGTGVLVGEDAIDKFVLKNCLERKKNGRVTTKIKVLRSVLTPTTSFANVLRGKAPWERDNRK